MADTRSLLTGVLQGIGGGLQKRQERNTSFEDAIGKMILEAKLKQELRKQSMGNMTAPEGARVSGYTYDDTMGYVPKYDVPSPKEQLEESDIVGSRADIPRYRKYAIGEMLRRPDTAMERVGQLEGKLVSKYPTQASPIKESFRGLSTLETYDTGLKDSEGKPVYGTRPKGLKTQGKAGAGAQLNPTNLARGMAQMFKNTETAMPDTSEVPAWQRIKGIGTKVGAFTGMGVSPRQTGEVATMKVRARSFLKNFENNRFTDKDIEQAIQGMTDIGKTTAERLATVVNVITMASAANGIPEEQSKSMLAKELGLSLEQIDNIIDRKPGALSKLKKSTTVGDIFNGKINKDLVMRYMKKYPNKTREEIVQALSARGQ